jgi:hypothetical protein
MNVDDATVFETLYLVTKAIIIPFFGQYYTHLKKFQNPFAKAGLFSICNYPVSYNQ